ncbi:DUF6702 family protein [Robertkochia sediminum]|uniref:DUF6702 family protein n=1 Tax=Robertkochia sediminum TaxID=2785326 RepID=UPI0019340ACC|nr:DUF6702 family protein [Robertkochia sediminum]MBL7471691.1 hypothetical protein [Robertkochia sediminum]
MKRILALLLCCLPLLSAGILHKYYVSVTDINYNAESRSIQIIARYFTDDLDLLLSERYGIKAGLMTDEESAQADFFIEKYLKTKFRIYLDGELQTFEFLGKEYDSDLTKCYLEIKSIDPGSYSSIRVENEVMTELFEEQKHITHIKFPEGKKSFLLHKGNDKALLNF